MELTPSSILLFTIVIVILHNLGVRIKKIRQGTKLNHSKPNLPPGPWKLPIIGSLHHMAGSLPHRALRDLAKKYGPLMHLQLGEVSTVVVSSPELAKEVLRTHDINFASRPEILAIKILFYNCTDIAFSPYGEYFTQLRKICMQELFSVKKDLFAGGGESAAATLDWTVAEMIKHPRILEKAQAEVRQVFDESQGEVREEGLEKLQYMKSVLKETLRLHTPAPLLLPRVAAERCEINGFDIPKKARVIVNAWAIGRDPAYWKEPETFNPDRFLGNPIEFLGNSFEYIPFGAGRRICPGMNFGLATLEYQLAMLLYHFDWKLPHGLKNEDVDMTELFGPAVKRKHDLYLIPTPYRPSQSNKHD
ncbi:hypothetical protein CRG98_013570 [Punica granatum]|uniref:Cytochrome P450 71D10-like n=1 Tax=Punica granatum TaxID=22663 RepID=A0A2I0KC05_PUNGR|nr:hypothetical protein CRG98_013570 [Punica granatum]